MPEQLKHKMINFEAMPPPAVWEGIAARLRDDDQYAPIAEKMNGYEAAPPSQIWNNVLSALGETKKEEKPVINIRRIIYRAAAAAIVVGFLIGGWVMIKKNAAAVEEVVKNTTPPVAAPAQPLTGKNKKENTIAAEDAPANENQPKLLAQNGNTRRPVVKKNHPLLPAGNDKENTFSYAIVNKSVLHTIPAAAIYAPPILDKNGEPIMDIDVLTINSNYLVVAGPNGQLTRISSKFANVIRYLNGNPGDTEEYLDKVIKESDAWKKRFQEWRNKISLSSYLPAVVNFLDILEFKDLIHEK